MHTHVNIMHVIFSNGNAHSRYRGTAPGVLPRVGGGRISHVSDPSKVTFRRGAAGVSGGGGGCAGVTSEAKSVPVAVRAEAGPAAYCAGGWR